MAENKMTSVRFYRVDKREIAFIRFIIEAYEGLAVLTTLDASTGHVCLRIAPGCESEVEAIMADLAKSIRIEVVSGEAEKECMEKMPAGIYG